MRSTATRVPWQSVPWVSNKEPLHAAQWHGRHGPPRGWPWARRWPEPSPPR